VGLTQREAPHFLSLSSPPGLIFATSVRVNAHNLKILESFPKKQSAGVRVLCALTRTFKFLDCPIQIFGSPSKFLDRLQILGFHNVGCDLTMWNQIIGSGFNFLDAGVSKIVTIVTISVTSACMQALCQQTNVYMVLRGSETAVDGRDMAAW
jgi:hypothetical protein